MADKTKSEQKELDEFMRFYEASRRRIQEKSGEFNESLKKDENPLLRMFKEDLADLNEGGKMLRGMLVNLGFRIAGGSKTEESDDLALAFEVFQTGVLIHDDIIDNAGTRRGKMTIHRRYENRLQSRNIAMLSRAEKPADIARSAAICTGDLGLYYANRMIADSYGDSGKAGTLISAFDDIVLNTIRGELLDVVLPYELQDSRRTKKQMLTLLAKSVRDIYSLKTAGYSVVGPLHLGMLLAGADEASLEKMDAFAGEIGIAYQIMDDILGIYAEESFLGKDVGSDISEFKQTILYMYVRTNDEAAYEELLKYYGKKRVSRKDVSEVRRIFRDSGALAYAQNALMSCFRCAGRKLNAMDFVAEQDKEILRGFMIYCRGRKK